MAWRSETTYQPTPIFEKKFRCLPFSSYKKYRSETGDKIIMPESTFAEIISADLKTPWIFRIQTPKGIVSHCGVLEFDAEDDCIHVPDWMMQNLKVKEGEFVTLQNATNCFKGNFVKLQPHETAFTQVSNMRAVLEKTLRDFSCLSRGDTIVVKYNDKDHHVNVLEVRPGPEVIKLIDTDCEVEFAQPLDYKEPEIVKKVEEKPRKVVFDDAKKIESKKDEVKGEGKKFQAFSGKAMRLDGEFPVDEGVPNTVIDQKSTDKKRKIQSVVGHEGCCKDDKKFKAFSGKSHILGTI